MRPRSGRLTFALVTALGFVLLLVAAATDDRTTALTLDVPDVQDAATLNPGQETCESPIASPASFGGVRAWAQAGGFPGVAVGVSVRRSVSNGVISRGLLAVTSVVPGAFSATLRPAVPAGQKFAICLKNDGPGRVALLGSVPVTRSVALTVDGRPVPLELSLVLLRSHPRSLLSSVPTMFDRAALFRPGWVGAWVFWVLAVALLVTAVLGWTAVSGAAREDESQDEDDARAAT
jgi:hypothetical protein